MLFVYSMITELADTEIKQVVVISTDARGRTVAKCIAEKDVKRKKRSTGLRLIEKAVRKMADAQVAATEKYQSEHDKSGRKRRDGALRDFPVNVLSASRKGMRKAKMPRFIW
jgi:hypothetical protein